MIIVKAIVIATVIFSIITLFKCIKFMKYCISVKSIYDEIYVFARKSYALRCEGKRIKLPSYITKHINGFTITIKEEYDEIEICEALKYLNKRVINYSKKIEFILKLSPLLKKYEKELITMDKEIERTINKMKYLRKYYIRTFK